MLITIYCVIGLIIFVVNVMALPEILNKLPYVPNILVLIAFIISFFAGVLWPITLIYGICHIDE
jgi:hypothetical protein